MFTRWVLLFTLAMSSWLLARANFAETAMNSFVEEFTKSCPSDGIPVCGARGSDYFLFPNKCWLDEVNAEGLFGGLFENAKQVPIKFCFNNCYLMCHQEYEPVCVSNIKTKERKMFRNMCEVTQYACRTNIDFEQLPPTACEETRKAPQISERQQLKVVLPNSIKALEKRSRKLKRLPIPCTAVFKPVCGAYLGVKSTFKNECLLNAENVKLGKDWRVIKRGICDEDYSTVRRNTNNKPAKNHSIRKRSYGITPNYMSFQNRYRDYRAAYNPNINMPSNDMYNKYMPQIFQTHYMQRDLSNSDLNKRVANNIIQKILALPAPQLDVASQELVVDEMKGGPELVVPNVKPLQYQENNMHINYNRFDSNPYENLSSAAQALRTNEILSSSSQAMDINSFAEHSVNHEDSYYYPTFHARSPVTQTTTISPVVPAATTSSAVDAPIFVISRRTTPKYVSPTKIVAKATKKPNVCKFGTDPICGVLSNGTYRTFDNVCEMMTRNAILKHTWVKLHNGTCETCKIDCSREYKPICIQRNGVNYTMVNECYYNMGICMDKRSSWNRIDSGECKRYTRIPDKYEHMKSGFKFTSKYSVTSTDQPITATTPISTSKTSATGTISNKATASKATAFQATASQTTASQATASQDTASQVTASLATASQATASKAIETESTASKATTTKETITKSSPTKAPPTNATAPKTTPTKPTHTKAKSRRRSRLRTPSSNHNVARRSRPAINSKPIEPLDSVVMNLANKKCK